MATNGTLQLNSNYIQTGLGTLTFTVPAAILNGPAVSNVIFNVSCQVTVPSAVATGAGAGTAVDQGLGALGGTQGIGQGSNLSLGNGGTGLGFGGSNTDGALGGNGSGHGAGAGGGGEGFTSGDQGLGEGGVGQGFGASNGYQQPPADVIVPSSGPAVSSSLVILVKQNGTTVYTAPTLSPTQLSLQFKTDILCNANDSITVVFSSSSAPDEAMNAIQANVSISNGS